MRISITAWVLRSKILVRMNRLWPVTTRPFNQTLITLRPTVIQDIYSYLLAGKMRHQKFVGKPLIIMTNRTIFIQISEMFCPSSEDMNKPWSVIRKQLKLIQIIRMATATWGMCFILSPDYRKQITAMVKRSSQIQTMQCLILIKELCFQN